MLIVDTESSGVKLGSLKVSFHSANVPDPEMCTSLSDHHLHPLSLSSEKLSSNDSMSSKDITTIPIQDPFLESYDHVQFIRQESDEESILSQDGRNSWSPVFLYLTQNLYFPYNIAPCSST